MYIYIYFKVRISLSCSPDALRRLQPSRGPQGGVSMHVYIYLHIIYIYIYIYLSPHAYDIQFVIPCLVYRTRCGGFSHRAVLRVA